MRIGGAHHCPVKFGRGQSRHGPVVERDAVHLCQQFVGAKAPSKAGGHEDSAQPLRQRPDPTGAGGWGQLDQAHHQGHKGEQGQGFAAALKGILPAGQHTGEVGGSVLSADEIGHALNGVKGGIAHPDGQGDQGDVVAVSPLSQQKIESQRKAGKRKEQIGPDAYFGGAVVHECGFLSLLVFRAGCPGRRRRQAGHPCQERPAWAPRRPEYRSARPSGRCR